MRFEEHLLREIQSTVETDQAHAHYRKRRAKTREERNLSRKMFWAAVVVWAATVIGALVIHGVAKDIQPLPTPITAAPVVQASPEDPEPVVFIKALATTTAVEPEKLEGVCDAHGAPEETEIPEEVEPVYYDIKLSRELQDTLRGVCEETGVPFKLALSVIWKETNYRNVKGDSGKSHGYMQVQPRWHKDRMKKLGVTDLMDPESNFRVGCDFLAELLDRYPVVYALSYYNSGKAKVSAYAEKVLDYMETLQ